MAARASALAVISTKPIGDTTILEIALHEVGLALERALLERARARSISEA